MLIISSILRTQIKDRKDVGYRISDILLKKLRSATVPRNDGVRK
jgi:hypothetical protein